MVFRVSLIHSPSGFDSRYFDPYRPPLEWRMNRDGISGLPAKQCVACTISFECCFLRVAP